VVRGVFVGVGGVLAGGGGGGGGPGATRFLKCEPFFQ
jgi:hypothetical protein